MNASLPVGHRDPRTEMVPIRYLHLVAKLVADGKQNLDYWNTVRVPQAPSDRLAFEELRQLAVFLPLVFVVFAFVQFRFTGASIAFICVLPLMKALNDAMRREIAAQQNEWHRRDAGRYAFTQFMCKEFDLKPEDVTMGLVLKMCSDFRQWIAVAQRLQAEKERAHRSAPIVEGTSGATQFAYGAGKSQVAASSTDDGTALTQDSDSTWTINPATGLPMMNGAVDIHGNVFGMANVDSLFNNFNHSSSFDASFQDSFGTQQEGFNSGGSGGFGYD